MLSGRLGKCRPKHSWTHRLFHSVRTYREDPRWPEWQVVVGIEVHAQIKSRRKLFSDSFTSDLTVSPNTHVSAFDASFPGTLPNLNPKCVDLALMTAVALDSQIQLRSSFDRKHYFYSDLPTGYQITQHYAPIALGGSLKLSKDDIHVRIKQIQLEQDTAKSTFDPRSRTSHIDLNRAGTGLMEIVSEPDMRSPEEAGLYVRTLQAVLRAIGSSDGNMEQGSLRCDVNVSVNRPGNPPGTRCEIKNLNSIKFMMVAITHEIHRQTALLSSSLPNAHVPQETRGFDERRFETYKLRTKEDAPDYRYMPDPNLGVIIVNEEHIRKIRRTMPELPWTTRARLKEMYRLSSRDVEVLMSVDSGREVRFDGEDSAEGNGEGEGSAGVGAVGYFDSLCAGDGEGKERDPKVVVNWMTHELLGQLAARKETFKDNHLLVGQMGELIDLVQGGVITGTSGKLLLRHMLATPSSASPTQIAHQLQLIALSSPSPSPSVSASQNGSPDELHTLCVEAISALPDEAAAVRKGNKNVVHKIVGRVMKNSRGRADAQRVKVLVEELIMGGGST